MTASRRAKVYKYRELLFKNTFLQNGPAFS